MINADQLTASFGDRLMGERWFMLGQEEEKAARGKAESEAEAYRQQAIECYQKAMECNHLEAMRLPPWEKRC